MESISTLIMEGKVTHPMDLLSCRFTKIGEEILTGSADGVMRKINNGNLTMTGLYIDQQLERTPTPITSIKFSNFSDVCLSTYAGGYVKYWNLQTGECLRTIEEGNQILGCAVSPLRRVFVTTTDNAKITLYDLETGSVRRTFEESYRPEVADGHKSRVFTAKFHPINPNEFLSGGWDNTVQFWDLRILSATRYIAGPHICGDGIDIDPTGQKVLTCSFEESQNLCLWDYNTNELLADFTTDVSKNYCGAFMGDNYIIAAGSTPSLLKILNMDNKTVIAKYLTPLNGLYAMDFFVPTNAKEPQTVQVITIASHILIKMKFLFRKESDFPVPQIV